MEQERQARENEEKERNERMKKIKDQFADPNGQWEKDKTDIQNEAMKEKAKAEEKEKEQEKIAGKGSSEKAQDTLKVSNTILDGNFLLIIGKDTKQESKAKDEPKKN